MPLRSFKCPQCNEHKDSFKKEPICALHEGAVIMESVLVAPNTKFMEKTDDHKGTSQMVGQTKLLKARARKHSRDHDTQDLIEMNPRDESIKNGWIKENGSKRKAIDDI